MKQDIKCATACVSEGETVNVNEEESVNLLRRIWEEYHVHLLELIKFF